MTRITLLLAALLGSTGVLLGAFGAHGLEALLEANGRSATFQTGTMYHLVHAVALLGVASIQVRVTSRLLAWAAYAFATGIILFSGSLYVLSIFNIGVMGAVAPLGGTAFVIGWVLVGVAAWRD